MNEDEDKTVIQPRTQGAPSLAATGATGLAAQDMHNRLPIGTRLGEFEITGVIGEGGFGIVYLANDLSLDRPVALKEYMPAALASRVRTTQVMVKSERHEDTFQAGLRSFINEARLLARFDHQSLVKVYRFWEANGTAYMVMPYYQGVTLKAALGDMKEPPGEAWLRALLAPLLEALALMHREHCYHRDIAPDNILLLKGSQRPVLLDFGAARRVIGDMTQALTVILKPGYAPVEQYAEVESLKQGPWTDLYAMGAVVYYAIQGRTPPTAVGRIIKDDYLPLAEVAAGRYSEPFLHAIDHALAVRPEQRPQSVQALALELGMPAPDVAGHADMERGNLATRTGAAPTPAAEGPQAPWRQRRWQVAGVVLLAGCGAWLAWMLRGPLRQPDTGAPAPSVASSAAAVAGAHGASAALPTPAPVVAVAPGASAPARDNGVPVPEGPFDLRTELERVVGLADRDIQLRADVATPTARVKRDRLKFRLVSGTDGFVYVFVLDSEGNYLQLFPNELDQDNGIRAGVPLSLPRPSWPMVAGEPLGSNRFLALVSRQPRDFVSAGLQPDSVFARIRAAEQQEAARRRTATSSPFSGVARCPVGQRECPQAYGATTFKIDVVASSK